MAAMNVKLDVSVFSTENDVGHEKLVPKTSELQQFHHLRTIFTHLMAYSIVIVEMVEFVLCTATWNVHL